MWLQPGGWVHKMFHDAWLPLTAEVALNGTPPLLNECGLSGPSCQPKWMDDTPAARPGYCCKPSASAAFSDDRAQVSLRFVNPSNSTSVLLTVELPSQHVKNSEGEYKGSSFSGPIQNTTDGCWKLDSVSQLCHDDLHAANTWNDTMHVSPTLVEHSGRLSFMAPPQSVSVARFKCEST